MKIVQAETSEEIATAQELFREYAEWLAVDLCFQNFEKELAGLPGDYRPPAGRLFLAREDKAIAGCVALRQLDDQVCEMKRLYVRPGFRGLGLGRQLTERVIDEARVIGYQKVRLDTLPERMGRAVAMYRSLGFTEIPRYYNNPYEAAMFMELVL
jgi:ribosomal protein S18 acetylase RimI-like enzyme